MKERDGRLRQFFAGYFNQDWDIGGATSWTDVVSQYVRESRRAQVVTIRDDLSSWLDDSSPTSGLSAEFGCDYDPRPEGMDDRAWVRALVEFIDRQLVN